MAAHRKLDQHRDPVRLGRPFQSGNKVAMSWSLPSIATEFESSARLPVPPRRRTKPKATAPAGKLKRFQRDQETANFAVVQKFREERSRCAILLLNGGA